MKISIVTVVLNAEKTIADTLYSVASQAFVEVEHLLIDGGSVDKTLAVARRHGHHLKKLVSEPDDGLYHAMNKGASLATGEVIGFLNSDDVYATTRTLMKVAQAFSEPSVDVCYGDLLYVDQHCTNRVLRHWKSAGFSQGKFQSGWAPPHPTFFVRRSLFVECGGFNTKYKLAADYDLMMRILECRSSKSKYLPEVLVKMRTGGLTNRNINNIIQGNIEILNSLKSNKIKIDLLKYILTKLLQKLNQKTVISQKHYSVI